MARLILLRHGESQWNLENRFTGWVDVPLSPRGIQEAKDAGEKLRSFTFDRAFTSVLARANEKEIKVAGRSILEQEPKSSGHIRQTTAAPCHSWDTMRVLARIIHDGSLRNRVVDRRDRCAEL